MTRRRARSRLAFGLFCVLLLVASIANALSPRTFHRLEQRVRTVVEASDVERAAELFRTHFDMRTFAQRCLADYWTTLTPLQQAQYRYLFTTLLERNVMARLRELEQQRARYTQRLKRIALNDDHTWSAHVAFRSPQYQGMVEYVFVVDQARWELIDYRIDNVSLSRNYRGHFNHVMRTRGYGGLVVDLQQKLRDLPSVSTLPTSPATG